jgi:hypothetical protein
MIAHRIQHDMVDEPAHQFAGFCRVLLPKRLNEQRRLTLEAEIATARAPAPCLHPNLAGLYRQKVANLEDAYPPLLRVG